MPAPIPQTCHDINKYIKYIKIALVKHRELDRLTDVEIKEAAYTMSSELENCIEYLEELRSSNAELRAWGESLEKEILELTND